MAVESSFDWYWFLELIRKQDGTSEWIEKVVLQAPTPPPLRASLKN